MVDLSTIRLLTQPAADRLNDRQQTDYERERRACAEWLLTFGKDPETAVGYAESTVSNRFYRMDQFYRYVWDQESRYTSNVTHEYAHEWMKELARRSCHRCRLEPTTTVSLLREKTLGSRSSGAILHEIRTEMLPIWDSQRTRKRR